MINTGETMELVELESTNEADATTEAGIAALKNGYTSTFVADTDGLLQLKEMIEGVLLEAGHVNFG